MLIRDLAGETGCKQINILASAVFAASSPEYAPSAISVFFSPSSGIAASCFFTKALSDALFG
jgi:hypothetical protein